MNVSDSERLEAALQGAGLVRAEQPDKAGLIVLNSCSVRASAEERVFGKLGELQRVKRAYPDTRIVLWGCMVGPGNQSVFRERLPMVDHFISPSAVDEVLDLVADRRTLSSEPALPIGTWKTPPVSVHVPIQYGCNMSCSYCVIPQRRGREVSRPLHEVVDEVRRIVARGAKEIVLLGQIVDSWGHDLPGRPDLSTLLDAIHDMPGLLRLRFLTSHPVWMTDKLIETVARLPRCQPEVNLPVQAGHDEVLRMMRRGYTIARYRERVGALRAALPGCALTTDVIVGYPGETAEHFEHTLALLEDVRFDKVHIAPFSARPGTYAAELEANVAMAVPEDEKQARRVRLERLQERVATEINARLHGQVVEVLVDGRVKGRWRGRTPTNKLVFFESNEEWTGRLIQVQVTNTSPWSLQGKVIQGVGIDEAG
jgi:tRNA-2-methylthio-N6-dimethylallyladenosine synthase